MSIAGVDRKAWRALFAAQLGWMLDAMDVLLFTLALVPIQNEAFCSVIWPTGSAGFGR
jgi:hypothetical protein